MGDIVNRSLTDRERFALDYEAHYNTGRWVFIYIMSREANPKTDNPATLKAAASRWKNINIVREYLEAAKLRENAKQQIAIDSYIRGNTLQVEKSDGTTEKKTVINSVILSDEDICRELTKIVKFGDLDDKEKAAALVQLGNFQRKADTTTDEDTVHRFYTPLQCAKCQLYKRAKKQLAENEQI